MKLTIVIVLSFITLFGCNNKPEVPPETRNYLSVYPNPTTNNSNIRIQNPDNSSFILKVFDTRGKLLLEKSSQGTQYFSIPLQEKPAGKYQVVLKIKQTVFSKTLLKFNR